METPAGIPPTPRRPLTRTAETEGKTDVTVNDLCQHAYYHAAPSALSITRLDNDSHVRSDTPVAISVFAGATGIFSFILPGISLSNSTDSLGLALTATMSSTSSTFSTPAASDDTSKFNLSGNFQADSGRDNRPVNSTCQHDPNRYVLNSPLKETASDATGAAAAHDAATGHSKAVVLPTFAGAGDQDIFTNDGVYQHQLRHLRQLRHVGARPSSATANLTGLQPAAGGVLSLFVTVLFVDTEHGVDRGVSLFSFVTAPIYTAGITLMCPGMKLQLIAPTITKTNTVFSTPSNFCIDQCDKVVCSLNIDKSNNYKEQRDLLHRTDSDLEDDTIKVSLDSNYDSVTSTSHFKHNKTHMGKVVYKFPICINGTAINLKTIKYKPCVMGYSISPLHWLHQPQHTDFIYVSSSKNTADIYSKSLRTVRLLY